MRGVGAVRVLATFAFSFSAAVFAAVYGPLDGFLVPVGLVLALFSLLVFLLVQQKSRRRRRALLVLSGLALGFLWTAVYRSVYFQPARELDGRTVRLTATVSDWPQETQYGGWSVLAEVDTDSFVKLSAVLYLDAQGAGLRPGDRLTTVTHCTLGDRTMSGGEEITYYTAKGIFLQGEAFGRLDVERPGHVPWRYWAAYLSRGLKEGIRAALPEREAALVQALVTGNRDHLTDQFTTSLQRTGLSHTVAVSGMHLAFLSELLNRLLGQGRRSTAVLTVAWVVLFCGVAGNTPSVLRAAVMILMLQTAPLLGRERDGPTALGLALMLLLFLNPFSAAHVGLQLSFAAVAGILAVSDPIQLWLLHLCRLDRAPRSRVTKYLRRVPYFVVSVLSATLGATVFTIPLVAWYFRVLSLIAPLANVLSLWAVSGLFLGGLAVGVVGMLSAQAAAPLGMLLVPLEHYLEWVVDLLSRPALAALSLDSVYYWAWIVFFYLLLALSVWSPGKKRVWVGLLAGAGALGLAVMCSVFTLRAGEVNAAILDVGQGQSVAIEIGGLLTLVDCGGDSWKDPGDVAADYIQSMGRSTLDYLVVTHYHADHANGVPQLLQRIQVDTVVLPDVEAGDPLREEIISLAREQGAELLFVGQEDFYLSLGLDQGLKIFAPMTESGDTNELGLSVLASAGEFDILVTGDMSGAGELELLEQAKLPKVELMVAGHHGSETSTTPELLSAVRPDVAAISVGKDNRYGHPSQEVLVRLAAVGAEIYRTDLNGTIYIHH